MQQHHRGEGKEYDHTRCDQQDLELVKIKLVALKWMYRKSMFLYFDQQFKDPPSHENAQDYTAEYVTGIMNTQVNACVGDQKSPGIDKGNITPAAKEKG